MSTPIYQRAVLLPRYYEKVAKATASQGTHPQIKTFELGHDETLLQRDPDPAIRPVLLEIPGDYAALQEVFFTDTFEAEDIVWQNGTMTYRCFMPTTHLTEPKQYSVTALKDQDGDIVAVCLDLPNWIQVGEDIRTYPAIDYPV